MLSTDTSEFKGTLQESPFAELLAETAQSNLGGSFRLTHEEEKAIIYLNKGLVVFAVSNHRQHRLFEVLLQSNQITREALTQIPEFTNDLALAKNLVKNNIFPQETINEIFKHQIREIIKSALAWEKGGWSFNHARAKENLQFEIDLTPILLEYARGLSGEKIVRRFKSFEERFLLKEGFAFYQNLFPQEGYIYSRLSHDPMKVQEIKQISGISDVDTLKNLYVLWIAGFTQRKNWNSIFTDFRLQQILSAKLILKKGAAELASEKKLVETPVLSENNGGEEIIELTPADVERKLLETYLVRVENADSYYEILGVPLKANLSQIKTAYFGLAKSYHPDRFHQETDVTLQQRVQNAFTELARAYETLKDTNAREVYDFKLRKFLESVEFQKKAAGTKSAPVTNLDKAREEFDQGFDFLMDEQFEEAIPFLTRAVQLASDNARYHAYFGKALSFVESQRFKAEAEIRQAMKLDSNNPSYWIMLAEFYVQFNLLKRAEGELQRLLAQFPGNREALALLDSLPNK